MTILTESTINRSGLRGLLTLGAKRSYLGINTEPRGRLKPTPFPPHSLISESVMLARKAARSRGGTPCSVHSCIRSALFPVNCHPLSSFLFLRSHNRRGHHRTWCQIVSHNHAALHHKFYSLHFRDVLERISRDC